MCQKNAISIAKALGIGAASFANGERDSGTRTRFCKLNEVWKRDDNEVSKDIAESPTAEPERQ